MHLVEVQDIGVHDGQIQAMRGVSLHVDGGEMVALVGANGAGRTTTLRTISGMLAPRGGENHFEGRRIDGLPAQEVVRRGVTHVPEGRELFPSLTVTEDLRMGCSPNRSDRGGMRLAMDHVMGLFPRLRERAPYLGGAARA